MNPEKPSRDEIEIRLTALLLGELPEEEARLLRWTITQDPELAKLHDQLKLTIGLVREVNAKPAEPATLKLSEDRRKKLLAHFQTPRREETFWVKPMKLPSLIPVLAAVAMIVVLAAMLLPALSNAKRKSQRVTQFAAARQREIQDQMGGEDRRTKTPESLSDTTISGRVNTEPATGVETVVNGASMASAPPAATPPASPPPPPVAIILPQTGLPETPVETGPEMTVNTGSVAIADNPGVDSTSRMPLADNFGGGGGGHQQFINRYAYQQNLKPGSQPRADGNGVATDSQELALQSGQRAGFGGPAGPVSEFKSSNSPKDDEWGLVPPPASLPLGQFPANKKLDSAGNNRDLAWDSGSTSSEDLDKRKIATKDVPLVGDVPVMGNLFSSNGAGTKTEASGTTLAYRSEPHELAEGENIIFLTNDLGAAKDQGGSNGGRMNVNDAVSLYAKLNGRTILRSSITESQKLPVPNLAGESKDEQIATLQQALAADNFSVVNVGDKFVKLIPANEAGSTAQALDNTRDLPLRRAAPNAPVPQPEVQTTANPFSTFTMNVSDVSFQLAAASLEKGLMPQVSSIRSEEFINAFDYRDPEAAAGQPIAFNSERAQDPFSQNRDLLRFSIKTATAGRQPGGPLNLVLLLDNSGSMERADRVAIIRESLRVLAAQLEAQDTITVVTFARTARLWLDGVPGNQAGAELEKVGELTPQGGTNLEEAMRLAYEAAHRHYLANGMNRVVLLTDGAANLGSVDANVLTEKVEANRKQGIALDCFGIGWEDFNDDLLEQLSSHGDGRYAFLNSPAQAAGEFAAKLAGALQIAAQDVKVQVEFNPDRVTAYRQIGYAKHQLTKEQFRDNSVAAGEIAAAEAGNALYTVELKPDGSGPLATVRLRYRVPGTTDYRERSWNVEYTGSAPALEKSSAAMRLAGTAAEFAEWLGSSPYAQQVTLDGLLNELNGVPAVYGADVRPKKLEWMIRQAKSVAGK